MALSCGGPDHYSKRGDEFYRSGRYEEASLNYRKALQKRPDLGDAYLGLGRSEFKQQHFSEAWNSLSRAVELLPNNRTAKIALGEVCLDGLIIDHRRPKNLYECLGGMSDQLLAMDPDSFPGLRFKGYLALIDGRMEEAVRYFRRAAQKAPGQSDVVISLVEALFQNQQEQEAERVAREFIASKKSHGAAYDALYVHYVNKGSVAEAEEILKLKVANNPDEPTYVSQLCQFYWSHGKQDQALELIARLPAKAGPLATHLAAGDFYGSISHWEDATREFQEGIRAAPAQRVVFEKRIANVLLAQGHKAKAASLVDEILKAQPQDQGALKTRAGLKLDSGNPTEILSAIDDYKAALRKNSRDPEVHYKLGRAFQLSRDFPSAKVEFREAMKADSYATQSRLGLADIALTERKLEESISLADEVISADPRNIPARRLRAMALRYSHRLDDARAELERVIKMAPQDKPAYLQLGLLEIELKDFRKAEMLFSKLRDLGGDSTDAAAGFAVMYTVRGQSGKAYEFLKRELKNSSDRAFAHELLAAVAIQDGQYDRAIDEYYSVLRVNPSAKGIYLKLADAFRSKGDLNSYVTALERAQKSAPGELLPTVLLAAALESKGQRDAAIQQYRRALELQPDDPRVLNNLAYAICEANLNLDEALRLAQRAVRKSPDQPNFADTLGWIYLKKSMPDDALQIFSNLLKKYPDDPSYRYHFGAALLKKGDMQGARVALMAAISNKPPKQEKEQILDLLARIN